MTPAAASTAKGQVARLLVLVPLLHARGSLRVEEAAALLGVSAEQVVKDLKVLFMCGLPGGYPDDLIDVDLDALEGEEADGVIRVSNADYLSRPLRLTPTEASAMIVALRALRAESATETREVVDRTLAKLEAAAAQGAAEGASARIDPGAGDQALARLRSDLEAAVRSRRQVRLTYYVPARDEESDRVVDPRGIVTAHGFGYLDAYCHLAEAPRLFRLDRIHHAATLDSPVASEPEPPRDLSAGFLQPGEQGSALVTLALDPPAHWVPEYYPVQAVRRPRGRGLEVDLLVADPRWLRRLLLRLAPHARVVSPPSVDEEFIAESARALGLYQHPPSAPA